MPKTEQNCCVLTLPLLTEPWQDHLINTRFSIIEKLKNMLIAHELRKLKNLERTREWKRLRNSLKECKDEKQIAALLKERRKMLKTANITEYGFSNDVTMLGVHKHFAEHINSGIAQRAGKDVWRSFEKYLYSNGRQVHFHCHPKRFFLNDRIFLHSDHDLLRDLHGEVRYRQRVREPRFPREDGAFRRCQGE